MEAPSPLITLTKMALPGPYTYVPSLCSGTLYVRGTDHVYDSSGDLEATRAARIEQLDQEKTTQAAEGTAVILPRLDVSSDMDSTSDIFTLAAAQQNYIA